MNYQEGFLMKDIIVTVLTGLVVVALLLVGASTGFQLDALQNSTLHTLIVICAVSVIYCFVVGEISRNNSQMDKLWSILPIIYAWVTAVKGGCSLRLVIMAILVSIWGCRLTYNFAKKGAYSLRFWEGEEDYRWPILRKNKFLKNKFCWALFDLFFISIFQNAIVLMITLPMVAVMSSKAPFGLWDTIATLLVLSCILYETIADKQQMAFQTAKWDMIKSGKKLEELPLPYSRGFNTNGLWAYARHPNYFAEQSTWVCLYLFTLGAGVTKNGCFNWSLVGSMLLILLFIGSSIFGESVSSKKYPLYKDYQKKVNKYLPLKKYKA